MFTSVRWIEEEKFQKSRVVLSEARLGISSSRDSTPNTMRYDAIPEQMWFSPNVCVDQMGPGHGRLSSVWDNMWWGNKAKRSSIVLHILKKKKKKRRWQKNIQLDNCLNPQVCVPSFHDAPLRDSCLFIFAIFCKRKFDHKWVQNSWNVCMIHIL